MGTAPAIPRLTRETARAAGPGRWVNCGVDPMRARGLWPPWWTAKPLQRNSLRFRPKALFVAEEAGHIEDLLGALEPLRTRRNGLVAENRRSLGTAAPPAVS